MQEKATNKLILTFVGMPGAGKSEATAYLKKKTIPFVRFGDLTDKSLQELGLPLTPENERMFREKIRRELGMAAYAIKAISIIESLLEHNNVVAIDGLYSWEEYVFLKNKFDGLILVHVFADKDKRYKRLSARPIRPVPYEKCYERDVAEIENLNKGGPIAMADYLIDNNDDRLSILHEKIDHLLQKLGVS